MFPRVVLCGRLGEGRLAAGGEGTGSVVRQKLQVASGAGHTLGTPLDRVFDASGHHHSYCTHEARFVDCVLTTEKRTMAIVGSNRCKKGRRKTLLRTSFVLFHRN